jgi:hypothetical protein
MSEERSWNLMAIRPYVGAAVILGMTSPSAALIDFGCS